MGRFALRLSAQANMHETAAVGVTATVLDHGAARTRRLLAALRSVGVDARLADTTLAARSADVLIVPDGDDDDAGLARGAGPGVRDAIAEFALTGRPLLAIGLGVSLLLEGQVHGGAPAGLGLFRAPVQRFDPRMTDEGERPLLTPHVGFALVVGLDRHPLLASLAPKSAPGAWFAFRHRLCAPARVPQANVAVCHHGVPFAGAIWKDAILAVQFLPEHSGRVGLELLRAFTQPRAAVPPVVEGRAS
ncbi:MAG: hypothetical protein HYS27_20285 [Deltaproteobacteria bacterium]|nr:hypothetical protein [Deltaproteobacteria bacterium]